MLLSLKLPSLQKMLAEGVGGVEDGGVGSGGDGGFGAGGAIGWWRCLLVVLLLVVWSSCSTCCGCFASYVLHPHLV